jgi:hypothetical protein
MAMGQQGQVRVHPGRPGGTGCCYCPGAQTGAAQ